MKIYGVYNDVDGQAEFTEPRFEVEGKNALDAYRNAFAELGLTLLETEQE